jgi:hypothetical protein
MRSRSPLRNALRIRIRQPALHSSSQKDRALPNLRVLAEASSERLAMLGQVLYHYITLAVICNTRRHIVSLAYSLFASFRYANFVLIRLVAHHHTSAVIQKPI